MTQRILRPLEYRDLFDETFDLYKRYVLLFVGISLLTDLPGIVIPDVKSPNDLMSLGYILRMVLDIPSAAAAAWAVSKCYLGEDATILSSYGAVFRRLFPIVVTMAIAKAPNLLGFTVLSILSLVATVCFAFVAQAAVIEKRIYIDALRRSCELVSGQSLRVVIVEAAPVFLMVVVNIMVSRLFHYLMPMGGHDSVFHHWLGVTYRLSLAVAASLVAPVRWISRTILYYDTRVRREAFDLEMLSEELERRSRVEVQTG